MSLDEPTRPIRMHESLLPKEHSLHRPRHSSRQRTAFTCAVAFFLVPALAFVLGARPHQIENHKLASFPSIADGFGFFQKLNGWATDNLPLRDAGIHAESGISNGLFGEPPPYSQNERSSGTGPIGPVSSPADPREESGADGFPKVIRGKDGWLYFGYDMQGKCQPVQPLASTIAALNRLRRAVTASGRKFVLVVGPDKSTVIPQHLPDSYAGKTCAAPYQKKFWQRITTLAGAIDVRGDLHAASKKAGMPTYYKKDTHWNNIGVTTMLRALAEDIQPGVTRTWRVTRGALTTGPADLPPMLGGRATNRGHMYQLAPDGGVDRARDAGVLNFLHPYRPKGAAVPGAIQPKTALLGDSFLLAGARYLPAVFGNCTAYYYSAAANNPAQLDQIIRGSKIVVLEVVERNLAAGIVQFLSPGSLAQLIAYLASHPMP
ncbi:MAG: alginate O-acetyltransferase AlgX-related protein [Sciscionella sp.]